MASEEQGVSEIPKKAKFEENVNSLLAHLDKNDVMILDDFGRQKMDEDVRMVLLMLFG